MRRWSRYGPTSQSTDGDALATRNIIRLKPLRDMMRTITRRKTARLITRTYIRIIDCADDPGLPIVSDDVKSYVKMVRVYISYADDL